MKKFVIFASIILILNACSQNKEVTPSKSVLKNNLKSAKAPDSAPDKYAGLEFIDFEPVSSDEFGQDPEIPQLLSLCLDKDDSCPSKARWVQYGFNRDGSKWIVVKYSYCSTFETAKISSNFCNNK